MASPDPGSLSRYSHLGLQFGISFMVCFYVGYRLDLRWGTTPLFAMVGLALGFSAGVYSLYVGVYGRPKPPNEEPKDR